MIRALLKRDSASIEAIHKKFFNSEFPLSDLNRFMTSFVSVDPVTDKVIVAGGIRSLAEVVIVTDKDAPLEQRLDGLLEFLNSAQMTTKSAGYDQLHCFIQDDKWCRHLIKHGFIPTIGKSLVIGVK